jgi:predicted regulator of Ras-like GTPase activity (Roadblock/LC7/MglB family)
MSATVVLLIDHDDMVLGLLRGSIVAKDPGAIVDTAKNKSEAYVKFQLQKYRCVFCDYDLLAENEFELMSNILANQDKDLKFIVSCYGNPADLKFDPYPAPSLTLSKPIDQRSLSDILNQLIGDFSSNPSSDIGFTEEISNNIEITLKELKRNTNARCIVVCTQDGRALVQEGETENIAVDSLASLVSGSLITLEEVGNIFKDPTIINLAFREGAKSDLYVMNIGQRLMLIIIQDKSMISPKIGTVWFYARQAAITIDQQIKIPHSENKDIKSSGKNNAIQSEDPEKR